MKQYLEDFEDSVLETMGEKHQAVLRRGTRALAHLTESASLRRFLPVPSSPPASPFDVSLSPPDSPEY